jgi:mannose-1-phosphate guanylyltransferase
VELSAIVLAGGAGSRLRPLTDDCPKPLLPLGIEPLVGYQLRRLAAAGVSRVVLATGYLADRFEEALGDGSRWGLQLQYSVEDRPLGTGGALRMALTRLPDTDRVVVLNGDLLSSHDVSAQLAALGSARACLHVRSVPDVAPYGQVRCDAAGRVTGFAEKSGSGPGLANAGTYVVRPDLLGALPEGPSSWERDVLPGLLTRGRSVVAWQGGGYFRDVGDSSAYRLASVDAVTGALPDALTHEPDGYAAPTAHVAPTTRLAGGSSVYDDAIIGARAVLDGTVILPGARVGERARLTRCVVAAGAVVAPGTVAEGQVLHRNLRIGKAEA